MAFVVFACQAIGAEQVGIITGVSDGFGVFDFPAKAVDTAQVGVALTDTSVVIRVTLGIDGQGLVTGIETVQPLLADGRTSTEIPRADIMTTEGYVILFVENAGRIVGIGAVVVILAAAIVRLHYALFFAGSFVADLIIAAIFVAAAVLRDRFR